MQKVMVQACNEKDMKGSAAAGTPKVFGAPNDCFLINVTLGTIPGEHTGGEQRRRGGDRGRRHRDMLRGLLDARADATLSKILHPALRARWLLNDSST